MSQEIVAKMDNLIETIEFHRRKYYLEEAPQITDGEYDAMERELVELEQAHPDLIRPHSTSFRVGGGVSEEHEVVEHKRPMLSLGNSYNADDMKVFALGIHEMLDGARRKALKFSMEMKIDGLSLSAIYQQGILVRAVTRGDGSKGEDVTLNAKTIVDLPLHIPAWHDVDEVEVRGEVYIPRDVFKKLNEQRLEAGLQLYANPRNAGSGALRQLDSREVAQRKLRMFIFQALGSWDSRSESHFGSLQALKALGFPINPLNTLIESSQADAELEIPRLKKDKLKLACDCSDALLAKIEEWNTVRRDLNYETDGVVIKVDNLDYLADIGFTAKAPKWATAYKFPAEQATTRVKSIDIQVGRTGVLSPVANLEPVQLAGTTVSRATLHNFIEIKRHDIRIGDWVFLEKGGEIIPKVTSVIIDKRTGDEIPIEKPTACPSCGEAVIHKEIRPKVITEEKLKAYYAKPIEERSEKALRCVNLACPAQVDRRIMHFSSRKAMDIQGLGKELVLLLVEEQILTDLVSIYHLEDHREKMIGLDGVGEKTVDSLVVEIEKSKQEKPFPNLLFAVGIPLIGEQVAELICNEFGGYDQLMQQDAKAFASVDGIGEDVAESLYAHLNTDLFREGFEAFRKLGLNLSHEKTAYGDDKPLIHKTIVLGGSISGRDRITDKLAALGGKVQPKISRHTHLLLWGGLPKRALPGKNRTRYEQAEEYGVEIVDLDWAQQWLDYEVEAPPEVAEAQDPDHPSGKTMVITGKFTTWSRPELTAQLKALGAKVSSSISKNTDFLVAGEKAGSKLAKAQSLNVRIVDEEWAKQWLDP